MSDDQFHSALGASSASRWMACPGSVRLSRGVKSYSSRFAEEGTRAHGFAEHVLRTGEPCNEKTLASWWALSKIEDEIPDDLLGAVETYVDFIDNLPGDWRRIEQRVNLGWLVSEFSDDPEKLPAMFGTADALVYEKASETLHVVDYKHGQGVKVEPNENAQALYYALGAVACVMGGVEGFEGVGAVKEVAIHIVQPRVAAAGGSGVKTWRTDMDRLVAFGAEVIAAADRTAQPEAPLASGDHCKWCPALASCPLVRKSAFEAAQVAFDLVEGALTVTAEKEGLSPEAIAAILEAAPAIRAWLDEVERVAAAKIEAGVPVPGYKMVDKRGVRKWTMDPDTVVDRLVDEFGGDPDDWQVVKPMSPAQAEKVLASIAGKDKAALKILKDDLAGMCEVVSSGTKLAPDSDSRAAVSPEVWDEINPGDLS